MMLRSKYDVVLSVWHKVLMSHYSQVFYEVTVWNFQKILKEVSFTEHFFSKVPGFKPVTLLKKNCVTGFSGNFC